MVPVHYAFADPCLWLTALSGSCHVLIRSEAFPPLLPLVHIPNNRECLFCSMVYRCAALASVTQRAFPHPSLRRDIDRP